MLLPAAPIESIPVEEASKMSSLPPSSGLAYYGETGDTVGDNLPDDGSLEKLVSA